LTNYIKKNIQEHSRWIQTEARYACIKKGRTLAACKHFELVCQISAPTSPHRLLFTLTV